MKKIILVIVCLFSIFKIYAQATDSEALLYNIGIGGVFATIGSVINKSPEEKINNVILKSFAQGSLGGLITFGSKCLLRETTRQQNLDYVWTAKIINAAGTSIIENAALNKNFWEKFHLNIGFNRIEFEIKDKFKIHYKLMPIALIFITDAFVRFDKFELEKSLKTGEFIFSNNKLSLGGAATLAGYIVFKTQNVENNSILNHEIIHIYQSNTYSVLNSYFQKPLGKLSENNKTINFINQYVYLDMHYIPLRLAYISQNKSSNYFGNFFEHEAGYFSNTLR